MNTFRKSFIFDNFQSDNNQAGVIISKVSLVECVESDFYICLKTH